MLNDGGSIVFTDAFEKVDISTLEEKFAQSEFAINKKEVITFNVRHAMQLDKTRIEKLISHLPGATYNKVINRIFRNFLGSAEQSKTFEDLGKAKDYICYVLKKKSDVTSTTSNKSLIDGGQMYMPMMMGATAGLFSSVNIK